MQQGELREYRRHGWGVFQEAAGYKYEGDWQEVPRLSARLHTGTLALCRRPPRPHPRPFVHPRPYSRQDERTGYGREVRENGDVYEGQFRGDRRHGRGRFLSVRGEEYDGGWLDGKRDGQGVSIVLPIDEAERRRQRVSASLLVHRDKHFLRLQSAQAAGRL